MENIIKGKLCEIEKRENVKIIYAVESGSRAWGFASLDSDYDVRFIYVRKLEDYLKLEKTRDVIEWQLDDVYDINGWDLNKTLRLLHSTNPTVFEWANSNIIYRSSEEWERVRSIINGYFSKKAGLHHYVNTAKRTYSEHLKGEYVRLKKYLYVIRPILACEWILEEGTPPPMLFKELAEVKLEKEMKGTIDELIYKKINSPESKAEKRIDVLNEYIEMKFYSLNERIEKIPSVKKQGYDELNNVFADIVGGIDN